MLENLSRTGTISLLLTNLDEVAKEYAFVQFTLFRKTVLFVFVQILLLVPGLASACTCFTETISGTTRIGCNYDWIHENGEVYFNPAGIQKRPGWTAQFASLSFNQHGENQPLGGMNEKGLVAHALRLETTQYPKSTADQQFNPLQFVQVLLDQFENVEQVRSALLANKIGIVPGGGFGGLHYLVCQADGKCLAVEFLNGAIGLNDFQDFPVITNLPYLEMIQRVRSGDFILPTSRIRSDRRAATAAEAIAKKTEPFEILDLVRVNAGELSNDLLSEQRQSPRALRIAAGYKTNWQIVFEPKHLRVQWRTARRNSVRSLDLKKLRTARTTSAHFDIHAQDSDCESTLMNNPGKMKTELIPSL